MKANELMVGDYLMYNKMPYRVTQISSIDAGLSGCSYILENGEEDCGEPIPLKRIHLVKNGFKADEKDEIFTYCEGYKVIVDLDDIFGGNAYLRIDFADKHLDIEIEYVHELQQAMRIMGCDKEIEL